MELKRKKVLVTGSEGFIGSFLVEALAQEGAQVRALVQYNSFNSWGWLEELSCLKDIEVVAGDVRDPHLCLELTRNIDIVFHLAALISIPYSYLAPESFVATNVNGTLNLCQAARASGVGRFLQTSTSEVYGTAQYVPIDEKHPLNPQSPYSATKVAADAIALSFWSSFQLPVVVARPFNTYGPRQSARAVIPTIISQLVDKRPHVRLGEMRSTRDFTFVEDTCQGLLQLARMEGGLGEVFHIGSNFEISIRDLFQMIAGIMNVNVAVSPDEQRVRPSGSEVFRLWCDNSKLEKASGFRPRTPLREGLCRTINWFQDGANLRRYKSLLYNV